MCTICINNLAYLQTQCVGTTSMRSASQNGWKRMQSVPTAIRLSPINLNITAIVVVRNRETLISPNPPK